MTSKEREEAVNAMFQGIIAAFNATVHEHNDPFGDCLTYAHAALASLEAAGFAVVRKASKS